MPNTPADLVDRAVAGPVVVYGSLPPLGRDLDLCLGQGALAQVESALLAEGFAAHGRTRWRATADGVDAVDLRTPQDWGLPQQEAEALFADGVPIEGYRNLRRPSPVHVLLLLARRVAGGDGTLDATRRERLERALAEDPQAWERAAARAPAWGGARALEVLRAAAAGTPAPRGLRRAAQAERARAAGDSAALAWARAVRATSGPGPRGRVLAISGLDGAGKSSQAAALVARLEVLGHPAVSSWTRLSADPSLDTLARPVKRLLRAVRRTPPKKVVGDVHPSRVSSPEQRLRQSSPVLTWGWATLVALSNGLAQRRSTKAHLAAGRTVVCDRWTLDSAVHLRYRYGEDRDFGLQVALIRALSPRPAATFFLDIPAETAYARKDDHYDVSQLARQERIYQQEHVRHGTLRLDGTRPPQELTDAMLPVALAGLARPPRRLRLSR